MNKLLFLKWGGSLITDKSNPLTPNKEIIHSLCDEFSKLIKNNPNTKFILGHGSGSFGHYVANKYGTKNGIRSQQQWEGFLEVWGAVRKLNEIVIQSLQDFNIPCLAIPPSVTFIAKNGKPSILFHQPFQHALDAKMVPVVFGDVIFDSEIKGTILSTEEIFFHLAHQFHPDLILLAGIEKGIYADFPEKNQLISRITPSNFLEIRNSIGGSNNIDVTGGMLGKVETMLDLVKELPELKIAIFSCEQKGNLEKATNGQEIGTWIQQEQELK